MTGFSEHGDESSGSIEAGNVSITTVATNFEEMPCTMYLDKIVFITKVFEWT
jgi:hypothetical protein